MGEVRSKSARFERALIPHNAERRICFVMICDLSSLGMAVVKFYCWFLIYLEKVHM